MDKNSITHLFEDVCLYELKHFNLFDKLDSAYSKIEDEKLTQFLDYLGLLGGHNLITDCIWCEGHFPFTYKFKAMKNDVPIGEIIIGKNAMEIKESINLIDPRPINNKILTNSIPTQTITIDYYFSCTNKKQHNYFMKLALLFDIDGVSVIKIGQYPENSSGGHFLSETYKTELRMLNDGYIDYKNSEKSYKRGLYVGAYDYLRRVYEKMIKYYLDKNKITVDKNSHTKDQIALIKHCFDKRIQDYLYLYYEALSCGVHIMPEEECKENYDELKAIIDVQLQFIKSEKELDSQVEKSRSALEKIKNKYHK